MPILICGIIFVSAFLAFDQESLVLRGKYMIQQFREWPDRKDNGDRNREEKTNHERAQIRCK